MGITVGKSILFEHRSWEACSSSMLSPAPYHKVIMTFRGLTSRSIEAQDRLEKQRLQAELTAAQAGRPAAGIAAEAEATQQDRCSIALRARRQWARLTFLHIRLSLPCLIGNIVTVAVRPTCRRYPAGGSAAGQSADRRSVMAGRHAGSKRRRSSDSPAAHPPPASEQLPQSGPGSAARRAAAGEASQPAGRAAAATDDARGVGLLPAPALLHWSRPVGEDPSCLMQT
jgi:hypothetical protein